MKLKNFGKIKTWKAQKEQLRFFAMSKYFNNFLFEVLSLHFKTNDSLNLNLAFVNLCIIVYEGTY